MVQHALQDLNWRFSKSLKQLRIYLFPTAVFFHVSCGNKCGIWEIWNGFLTWFCSSNVLLVAPYVLLVARYFLLVAGYFFLVVRYFLLVARCLLFFARYFLLVARYGFGRFSLFLARCLTKNSERFFWVKVNKNVFHINFCKKFNFWITWKLD